MNQIPTTDLHDAHPDQLQLCELPFRDFGKRRYFHGPLRTVLTVGDTKRAQELFRTPGHGGVIVIDGGGALRTAMLGDVNAKVLIENGWAGIVINGAVRDSSAMACLDLGIKALATTPARSAKTGLGATDIPIAFGGALFRPGDHVYCDPDGVVVSTSRLMPASA